MLDSLNFLSLECLASLRCPPVSASFEDAIVGVHCREVEEESGRGAPLGDLNEHPHLCGHSDIYHHVTNDVIGVFMRYNF